MKNSLIIVSTEQLPRPSSLLSYLPAFYSGENIHKSEAGDSISLNTILLAFEKILDRIESTTNNLPTYFYSTPQSDQSETPVSSDFIEWLAGWAAISLREDWTPAKKRNILKNAVRLYKNKGTKDNLIELLKIYVEGISEPKVIEPEDKPFRILKKGDTNGICLDKDKGNRIGGAPPFFFEVEITLPRHDSIELLEGEFLKRQRQAVKAAIDLCKPAHTHYNLTIYSETILIGNRNRCVVGKNMLIGNLKQFTSSPSYVLPTFSP